MADPSQPQSPSRRSHMTDTALNALSSCKGYKSPTEVTEFVGQPAERDSGDNTDRKGLRSPGAWSGTNGGCARRATVRRLCKCNFEMSPRLARGNIRAGICRQGRDVEDEVRDTSADLTEAGRLSLAADRMGGPIKGEAKMQLLGRKRKFDCSPFQASLRIS
ncbi:hypothetical protein KM043_005554 [Ampulex compressa]|nr:hypothetical protein KM043_005554 [Ampulex compressa]